MFGDLTSLLLKPVEAIFNQLSIAFVGAAVGQLQSAFTSHFGTVDQAGWSAGIAFASKLAGVVLVVIIPLAAFQLVMYAIRGNFAGMLKTFVKAAAAWPATLFAMWVGVNITSASDQLSSTMIGSNGQQWAAQMVSRMSGLGGISIDTSSGKITQSLGKAEIFDGLTGGVTGIAAEIGVAILCTILFFVIWLLSLGLTMLLAGRAFGLIVLIGFAPLGIMPGMGLESLDTWRKRYVEMLLGLILVGPAVAGVLTIAENIGQKSDSWQMAIMSLVGFFLALLAPRTVMKAVHFAGDMTAMAIADRGQALAQSGLKAAKNAVGQGANALTGNLDRLTGNSDGDKQEGLKKSGLEAAGTAVGGIVGGPAGAMAGHKLGSFLADKFGNKKDSEDNKGGKPAEGDTPQGDTGQSGEGPDAPPAPPTGGDGDGGNPTQPLPTVSSGQGEPDKPSAGGPSISEALDPATQQQDELPTSSINLGGGPSSPTSRGRSDPANSAGPDGPAAPPSFAPPTQVMPSQFGGPRGRHSSGNPPTGEAPAEPSPASTAETAGIADAGAEGAAAAAL